MRIHRIDVLNLASLYGTHSVDLDTGLGGAGLFLIHGPMGSGKTTLLDAICLALFGQTPRMVEVQQKKQAKLEDHGLDSPVHLMSRGTGHCRATVEFSLPDAEGAVQRYRATWELWRARYRPEGNLQSVVRRLESRAADGTFTVLVESEKVKLFEPVFNDALRGLTFEDFTRTVMLAQFAFQQFLLASADERAKLLERLTDSARFKALGLGAAEAYKAAKAVLDTRRAQVEGTRVLPENEEAALRAARAERETLLVDLRGQAAALETVQRYFAEAVRLKRGVEEAAAALAQAEADLAGLAPELERLTRHERMAPAAAALVTWEKQIAARDETRREAAAAAAEAREKATEVERLTLAHANCDASLRRAVEERDANAPALQAAEAVWQSWSAAKGTLVDATRTAEHRTAKQTEADATLARAKTSAADAENELAATRTERAQIPHADALSRALAGLKSGRAHAASLRKTAEDRRTEAAEAEARRDKRDADLTVLEADLPRLAGALQDAETHAATAAAALARIGGDMPAVRRDTARAEAIRAEGRAGALDRAQEADRKCIETTAQAEAARADAIRLEGVAAAHAAVAAGLQREMGDVQGTAEAVERELRHIDRQIGVVDRRDALVEGEACPLCGGLEHPYRVDPSRAPTTETLRAEHREAEGRRAALQARLAALAVDVRTAESNRAQSAAQAAAAERRGAELLAAAAERATERDAARVEAAWPADRSADAHRAALAAEAEAARRLADAIEAALTEHQRRQSALDETRRTNTQHTDRVAQARALLADATNEAAAARARATEADAAAGTAEAEQMAACRALGLDAPSLDEALALAKQRFDRAEALARLEETRRARVDDTSRELTRATEASETAAEEARLAATARAEAEAAVVATAEETRRHFDGADPADLRHRLNTAVEHAQTAATESERTLAAARTAHAAADARRVALETNAETAARLETEARTAYEREQTAAGAASPDEVRAATLTEVERQTLTQARDRANDTRSRRAAVYEDMQRQCARHTETRPADAEGDPSNAETCAEQAQNDLAALDFRIDAVRAEQARDDAALESNERARATLAGLAAAITEAEAEHDAWKAIHDTIGVNDGGAFVIAVQSLNLRTLLDRANARLAQFLDRYRLEQIIDDDGAPRIDFWLIDAYQQNARRPTRSLSGGESFIVALALALGLADLRAARFRIETLLIDEGFGAVDQQTLREILAVLEALRDQTGTRIGVISHVEMMKEVIPAQIEVVRNDDGRSSRLVLRG